MNMIMWVIETLFLSMLWEELLNIKGVALHFFSAYYPQTDGQKEVVIDSEFTGCLWWNGGITPTSTHPLIWPLMRWFIGNTLLFIFPTFLSVYDRGSWLKFTSKGSNYWTIETPPLDGSKGCLRLVIWFRWSYNLTENCRGNSYKKLGPKYFGPFPVLKRIG